MLTITIPDVEMFNENAGEDESQFYILKGQTLRLEHSLVSLAKWEAEWEKPFLSKEEKTRAESLSYIRYMTITQNVDPELYKRIDNNVIAQIDAYIDKAMTATTFRKDDRPLTNREIITAEIIYYWMVTFNIPPEYQKWHLNRLLTLINVCNLKNQSPKNMKRKDLLKRQSDLNALRRKKLGTTG